MKLDRLIGIITTLQRKGRVTAPYLAEKFEVSRRTISRDIEEIDRAGIPIVTTRGAGGGISIMEGFALDTTVFTKAELSAILAGLRSVDSVSRDGRARSAAGKLGGDVIELSGHMMIDLSSFYKDDLAAKLETIRAAIEDKRRISFRYCYEKGEADKALEPYLVVFRWSDWYVYGWSPEREGFRMYKLRRLWDLTVLEETFTPGEMPEEQSRFGAHMTDDYMVTAVYDPLVKYRLVEEYGPASFTEEPDGSLYARWGFSTPKRALDWFLSFGSKVKVLSPPELVERMREELEKMKKLYET